MNEDYMMQFNNPTICFEKERYKITTMPVNEDLVAIIKCISVFSGIKMDAIDYKNAIKYIMSHCIVSR